MSNQNKSYDQASEFIKVLSRSPLAKGLAITLSISVLALILFMVYSKHAMLYSLLFGMVVVNVSLYLLDKQELGDIYDSGETSKNYLKIVFINLTNFVSTWGFRGLALISFFLLNPVHALLSGVFASIAVLGLSVIFNHVILPWYRNDHGIARHSKEQRIFIATFIIYVLRILSVLLAVFFSFKLFLV